MGLNFNYLSIWESKPYAKDSGMRLHFSCFMIKSLLSLTGSDVFKRMKKLILFLMLGALISCTNNEDPINNDDPVNDVKTLLYGSWDMKTMQGFSKEDGVENVTGIGHKNPGESIITFSEDGTGKSNEGRFSYIIKGNVINARYFNCGEGGDPYEYWEIEELKSDELILLQHQTYIDKNNYGYWRLVFEKIK